MQNVFAINSSTSCASVSVVPLHQQCPTRCDHDHPATDLHHRQRNSKKREHMRSDRERCNQEDETVQSNTPRQQFSCGAVIVEGQGEEYWGSADRIYDRKESAYDQENALRSFDNHASLPITHC